MLSVLGTGSKHLRDLVLMVEEGRGRKCRYLLSLANPCPPILLQGPVWHGDSSLLGAAGLKTIEGGTRSHGFPGWGEVKLWGEGGT